MLRTHIGFGSPNKQDTYKAHGSPLGEDEVRLTKEVYGWDPDAHFLVPDEVLEHYRETAGERGAAAEADWEERAAAYRAEHADAWEELSLVMEGRAARRLGRRAAALRARGRAGGHAQGLVET